MQEQAPTLGNGEPGTSVPGEKTRWRATIVHGGRPIADRFVFYADSLA